MGSKKVSYNPPPPDDTFSKYLAYQQEREKTLDARAQQEKAEAASAESARKASGAAGYAGLKTTTQQQLAQGLIGYESAANQLRDYASRYDLTPPEADISELTQQYTAALPGKRATGISASYEELLGRSATQEELSKAQERFQQGYYGSMEDFKGSLTKSQEYLDKFNTNYLDNYYDTMFGKQTTDAAGKRTGQRTLKFASNLVPTMAEGTQKRSGVITPDFGESFTGTPAEIEEQQQNIRDTRQYLYSAGLTNLQGEIDKETQQLKNEGSQKLAKIQAQGNIYTQLVGSFSF